MKLIKHISIWVVIAAYLFVMLAFVDKEQDSILCRRININIRDSLEVGFVTEDQIMKIIHPDPATLLGKPLPSVNIGELENTLHKIRSIQTAEVYYDVEGHLSVDITQRKPMVRLIDRNGRSFCMDNEGYLIPLNGQYVPHVLIVNGIIGSIDQDAGHIDEIDDNQMLEDIYRLSHHLNQDPLLQAQIVQVYVNGKNEFELIPRVGAHVILLGKLEGFEVKLDNLRSLYDQGFSTAGWNQFEIINLKYENQVVCTKR